MIRTLLLALFFTLLLSCSAPNSADTFEELETSALLEPARFEEGEIRVVNGVFFEVEDFDMWMEAYRSNSKGLIIALRNVDAPRVTLIFEGSENKAIAEERVKLLSSKSFLEQAKTVGDPISSYHKIEYFDRVPDPSDHYVALTYSDGGGEQRDWIDFTKSYKEFFDELGITVAGIGTNPDDRGDAYILFRQKDFVAFKKLLNSPRKIDKFLEKLELPDHTMISYWARISQPAD